jgi:hypothetical protein
VTKASTALIVPRRVKKYAAAEKVPRYGSFVKVESDGMMYRVWMRKLGGVSARMTCSGLKW